MAKNRTPKIAIILGTRPEIIKMSPVIRACQQKNLDFFILHTNQHYSKNLDQIFFDELELPRPKYNLGAGSGTHAQETAKMLIGIEEVLAKENPFVALVEGDTNTVLSGALAVAKLHIKVGHIEAGLRSYCRIMPEEINRIIADQCSDFLFAPTKGAKEILIGEGVPSNKITITGNTIVDAVCQSMELSKNKSKIFENLGLGEKPYFLLTIHREENVDNKERLMSFLAGLDLLHKKYRWPIIYPMHPRTKKMLVRFKTSLPKGIVAIDPMGFLDFLQLESGAKLIMTDSGGIQEEACILKVPCVTLRDNTERPETIEVGGNVLSGANPQKILQCASKMLNKKRNWKNPFGSGQAGKKIVDILISKFL